MTFEDGYQAGKESERMYGEGARLRPYIDQVAWGVVANILARAEDGGDIAAAYEIRGIRMLRAAIAKATT